MSRNKNEDDNIEECKYKAEQTQGGVDNIQETDSKNILPPSLQKRKG